MSALVKEAPKAKDALEVIRPQLSAVLPKHVDAERFMRSLSLAVSQNPYLLELDRMSLLQSAMKAAELGLTPNSPLGECYLLPYGRKVQMVPGYRGMITLARRSAEVSKIGAHVVYEGEVFEITYGPEGTFKHVPNLDATSTTPRRFPYAYALFKDGTSHIEVVPRWKVEKIKKDVLDKIKDDRRKTRAQKIAESPWTTWEDEQWRKTAIRALFKYLPVSTEDVRRTLERALEIDDEAAKDRGEFTGFDAVEVEVVEDEDAPAKPDATSKLAAALAGPKNGAPTPDEIEDIRAREAAEAEAAAQ